MYFERRDSVYWQIRREIMRYPALFGLIFVMFFMVIIEYIVGIYRVAFYLAFIPYLFLSGFYWTLITHIFLHANFLHFFFNAIALYFVGRYSEQLLGSKLMLLSFLLSGIVGGLLTLVMALILPFVNPFAMHLMDAIFLGASGAIFGLFAILVSDRPNIDIIFFLFLPIIPIILPIRGKGKNILMMLIIFELIFGLLALPGDPYGRFGHLGGMLTGVLLYRYYLWKKIYERVYGVEFYSPRGW